MLNMQVDFDSCFNRTGILLGDAGLARLRRAKVAVFGLGGVGAYAAEGLARAPVGELLLVDRDTVQPSNLNRQLPASLDALGRPKVEVVAERLRKVNPELIVNEVHDELRLDNASTFLDGRQFDYVVDAIDMVGSKVALLQYCHANRLAVVSSMGAARRLDPTRVRVADISKTRDCPLARDVRKQLRKLGIHKGIKVVYSDEEPLLPSEITAVADGGAVAGRGPVSGSISYMPGIFGLVCASVVVRGLLHDFEFAARGKTSPSKK